MWVTFWRGGKETVWSRRGEPGREDDVVPLRTFPSFLCKYIQ